MTETEGFTVRTALMPPVDRAALLGAALATVRSEAAALRCGLPATAASGWSADVAAAVGVLQAAAGLDDTDPERPRTRLIGDPSPAVLDAVATTLPVALHGTVWDDDANLLLDVINGDRFWVRLTSQEMQALVDGLDTVRVVPDGDWVPGTNSRAKRAWGRRTKSRFRG